MIFLKKKAIKGQILVLIAVAMVGILGFMAIAVDGGMVFADRRYSQNVSDAAALAGAADAVQVMEQNRIDYGNFDCSSPALLNAIEAAYSSAIGSAANNDFIIENNLDNNHGVSVTCQDEDVGGFKLKYLEITVIVSSKVETTFLQMITQDAITNTVKAISRVRPKSPLGLGNSLIALDTQCDDGMEFKGNPMLDISGGGVFSNSCIRGVGIPSITVHEPEKIYYVTEFDGSNNPNAVIEPPPMAAGSTLPKEHVPRPNCGSLPNAGSVQVKGNETLSPGAYSNLTINAGAHAHLEPGLYCFENDIKMNGQAIISGNGVTLYLINGAFNLNGGAEVNLSAPYGTPDEVAPAVPGLLIYMAEDNSNSITMVGNAASRYVGTVYAPSGTVEIGGTQSTLKTLNTQIIGDNVFVHGTADVTIVYRPEDNYQYPAMVDLYE
jgi:hypothetical protein